MRPSVLLQVALQVMALGKVLICYRVTTKMGKGPAT